MPNLRVATWNIAGERGKRHRCDANQCRDGQACKNRFAETLDGRYRARAMMHRHEAFSLDLLGGLLPLARAVNRGEGKVSTV